MTFNVFEHLMDLDKDGALVPRLAIRPNNNGLCACLRPARWTMRASEGTIVADALYGTAPVVDGASALFGGGPGRSQARSNQHIRVYQREQPRADYFAAHPGLPQIMRIRGGDAQVALVRRARVYVCSHQTQRFLVAIKYAEEETARSRMASDLSWCTLDIVQGHALRWLVEVLGRPGRGMQAGRSGPTCLAKQGPAKA